MQVAGFALLDDDVACGFGKPAVYHCPAANRGGKGDAAAENGVFMVAVRRVRGGEDKAVGRDIDDGQRQCGRCGNVGVEEGLQFSGGHVVFHVCRTAAIVARKRRKDAKAV